MVERIIKENYNTMIESVSKYGGFFVGRYETSYDSNNLRVASLYDVTPTNAYNPKTWMWYGLYQKQNDYSKDCNLTSLSSSMIWGSQ